MTKDDFITRYRAEMADVQVSPQLKRKTLDLMVGKEKPIMKKKLSAAAVLVIVIVLACAAALAAATRAGILDFAGRYAHSYTPEDAQDYVQTDVVTMENDIVTARLSELYYDGLVVRMTVDVTPKASSIMLLFEDMAMDDLWQNMTHMNGHWDESDTRTVADVYREGGYTDIYYVSCRLKLPNGDSYGGVGDYNLSEDGTLTLYDQTLYDEPQTEMDAALCVSLFPYDLESDKRLVNEHIEMQMPVTLRQAEYANETYVSTESAEYPSIGVRVDEIRMEVRAQDIHYTIDYTVIDREKYDALDHGLWFEFIDPESTAVDPWEQTLQGGMTGSGEAGPTDGKPMDEAIAFRQTDTLGRNELHEAYTLRAYECWEQERFETRTFAMTKVE